jgi:DNA-binding MarR family transcriptional regulator
VVRALGRAVRRLQRAFDADLLREQGLTNGDYSILRVLSEAPGRSLRLTDLAGGCGQSLSATSRTVDRLEAQGWVARAADASDGRSRNVHLTETGLQRLESAWPTHVASVRHQLLDHLAGIDLAALADALDRVAPDPGPRAGSDG